MCVICEMGKYLGKTEWSLETLKLVIEKGKGGTLKYGRKKRLTIIFLKVFRYKPLAKLPKGETIKNTQKMN